MRIRESKADIYFSLFIRERDGWKCRRCGRSYKPYLIGSNNRHLMGIHNMHCFGRGGMSTRFYELNCMAGCYGCHSYLDQHPDEKYAFWIKEIGETAFSELKLIAKKSAIGFKKNLKDIELLYFSKFKELYDKRCNTKS
jgi:hypothetical protein